MMLSTADMWEFYIHLTGLDEARMDVWEFRVAIISALVTLIDRVVSLISLNSSMQYMS